MFDGTVKLHYKQFGAGPELIIMHGLLGSLDNWSTIYRHLAAWFTVYVIDLRNHGKSPHADEINYAIMAKDVFRFIEEHRMIKPHLLGHSMGGKVLLEMIKNGKDLLGRQIILDITPKAYPDVHSNLLKAMMAMPLEKMKTRTEADEWMQAYIPDHRVRQFILKNLDRNSKQEFAWKVNLISIAENYANISSAISFENVLPVDIFFVHGQLSDYVNPSDEDEIMCIFPLAKFIAVANAGHWIHADQPQKLIELVQQCFLNK